MTGNGRDMYPGQEELPGGEPTLEQVLRALTAEGDATELVGRQAALIMFRTARGQAAPQSQAARGWAEPGRAARDHPTLSLPAHDQGASAGPAAAKPASAGRAGTFGRRGRRPRRFSLAAAIAVGLAAACAGMAAAYAAVLPPSVQNIAHHVLAPLGVPSGVPASCAPAGPGSGSLSSNPAGPVRRRHPAPRPRPDRARLPPRPRRPPDPAGQAESR